MPPVAPTAFDLDGPPPDAAAPIKPDPAGSSKRAARQEAEWAVHGEKYGVAWLPGQEGTSPYNQPDAQEMLHAASFGFSDDIGADLYAARVMVKNAMGTAQGKKPRFTADEARQAYLEVSREARQEHERNRPMLSAAEGVGGSFLTPGLGEADAALAARGAHPLVRAAALGGAVGGASAAGNAQGTVAQRAKAVPAGVVEGALSGLAFHLTAEHGANFVKGILPALKHSVQEAWEQGALAAGWKPGQPITAAMRDKAEKAAMTYVKEITRRLDPTGAKLSASEVEARGKQITAAEALGRTGEVKLKAAMRRAGTTGAEAEAQLGARRRGAAQRIVSDFAEFTGITPESVNGDFDKQIEQDRKTAAPLYKQAFSHTGVDSPELQTMLKRVEGTKAVSNAYAIAKLEGRNPEELGLIKQTVNKPTNLVTSSGAPVTVRVEEEVEVHNPTLETWDYIKRGLQDVVYDDRNKVPGGLQLGDKERATKRALDDLRAALTDPDTPWGADYKAALDAGGEAPRLKESWEAAGKLMRGNVSIQDFTKSIKDYTPAQLKGLRAGIIRDIRDAAMADTPRKAASRMLEMTTEAYQAKLARVFGKSRAAEITQRIEDERFLLERGNRILSGSDTAENLDAMQEQERGLADAEKKLGIVKKAFTGKPVSALIDGVLHVLDGAREGAALPMAEAERDVVGKLLLMKPSQLAAELEHFDATLTPGKASQLAQQLHDAIAPGLPALRVRLSAVTGGAVSGAMAPHHTEDSAPEPAKPKTPDSDGFDLDGPPTDGGASSPPKAPESTGPGREPHAYESNTEVQSYLGGLLGRHVEVTSGYRDPEHNAEVGGVPNSQHTQGKAWDFKVPGMGMQDAANAIIRSGAKFDVLEITPTHVHISFSPENRGKVIYGGQQAPQQAYAAYAPPAPSHALAGGGSVDWNALDTQP